jgi:hypothetical protein
MAAILAVQKLALRMSVNIMKVESVFACSTEPRRELSQERLYFISRMTAPSLSVRIFVAS